MVSRERLATLENVSEATIVNKTWDFSASTEVDAIGVNTLRLIENTVVLSVLYINDRY